MASTSGRFNSGPRDLGEIVRQYFDELLDVDICAVSILPFTEQFSAEELQMIRAAFLIAVFVLERGPVIKLLTTAISKNVANLLHDAVDIMARKRALLESDTDTEAVSVSEYSISESDTSVSTSRLPEDNLRSQDCGGHSGTLCPGQGGSVLAKRGVTETLISSSSSSRNSSCSSITSEMSRPHSTSTCSVKDLPTERPHVSSSSLSTRPEEAVATLAMSSHEDSANMKSSRGEDKQRRKRIFTIHWKSKRSIAPSPVVEKPVTHSPERTRRPSLSSRLASGICRLFCCCGKGQD
ncbi:uncharacterized protein LOC116224405 isoform X2 [Clupea harengus]|uniref:Uncharacterized protein LOC116224405 isoform X2 n=1 Tax=Clupea harengus TaxID=7950 RepID=A0A6P8GM18_CLUHA|nr:uncharacterized protein LOC116224405 isoform X2 [Clupea harengus]